MAKNLCQILLCYVAGLLGGNLLFFPLNPVLAPALFVGGLLAALPELVVVLTAFVLFREHIIRKLFYYCLGAPLLIVLIWLIVEWNTNYYSRGQSIEWYLSLRNVWERAILAFVCSSISSYLFWRWNRAGKSVAGG